MDKKLDNQLDKLLVQAKAMEDFKCSIQRLTRNIKEIAITTAMIADYIWQDQSILNRLDMAYKIAGKFVDQYPADTNWHELKDEGDWDEIIYEFVDKYLTLNNRNNG